MEMQILLADLLEAYRLHRPHEVPTLDTILRRFVLPAIDTGQHESYEAALAAIPALRLYAAIRPDRRDWSEAVKSKLPPGATYHKAYLRATNRLIVFGESEKLLFPDEYLISPSWRSRLRLLAPLVAVLPAAKRYALTSSFRRLAKWATAASLEPEDFLGQAPFLDKAADFMAGLPPAMRSNYFRARRAWNLIVERHPDRGLTPWPRIRTRQGVPPASWPAALREGVEAFFCREGLGTWSDQTKEGYVQRIAAYLGALGRLGVDVGKILESVPDGKEALRLLFQGNPPGFAALDYRVHAHELVGNAAFRSQLLSAMKLQDGVHGGRGSDANPLLVAALTELVKHNGIASAAELVTRAMSINRALFKLTSPHVAWLSERAKLLGQAAKRRPSKYLKKKRQAFRNPTLWVELVASRREIRKYTESLKLAWREAPQDSIKARAWAVALRNEVIFGLLLCYPLRVGNLVAMKVEEHYDPVAYCISFPAEQTKNAKAIDYVLPAGGSLGDLRRLMDEYLDLARPLLLGGRQSDRVFVGCEKGRPWITCKTVHAILAQISVRHLTGVLPKELGTLNPHMLRHVKATFHIAIGKDVGLAAQMLNDSPSTVLRDYADLLEDGKEATRRFLTDFNL